MVAATAPKPKVPTTKALGVPSWASGMADMWSTLPFDSTQTIIYVATNNQLGISIADTGAYKTVMDMQMAQAFGLPVHHVINVDCSHYAVPGSGIEHDYAGVMERSFVMRLGENVSFTLTGMRVIDHPFALFLLGADVLCGGCKAPAWNYEGIAVRTSDDSKVSGSVKFRSGLTVEEIPLAQAAQN